MNLTDLQKEAHAIAVDHGWYDTERTFGDFIALVHSEVSEAFEAYRRGGFNTWDSYPDGKQFKWVPDAQDSNREWKQVNAPKPEGVAYELADVVIRVVGMAEHYGVDLSKYNVPPVGKHPNRSFGTWITGIHWYMGAAYKAGAYQWWHEEGFDLPRGQEWVDRLGRTIQEVLHMAAHYGIDLDAAIEAKMAYNKNLLPDEYKRE